ncbi:MAG: S8 family serine peptidase [Phycisphaerae bacterium]
MKTQVKVLAVLLMIFVVLAGQSSAQEIGRYIVTIEGPPGPAEQAVLRAGGAVDHVYDIIEAIAIRIPEAALPGFSRNPFVVSIEPDIKVYAIDAELDNSWGVKRIGAGTVHDAGNKGTGVKVAIIDSGIDYNHDDLDANYKAGYDFVNEETDPMDDNGHGTHVAGTVAAEDNGFGVVGVAPEAYLYGLKVLDAGGSGYYSDIISALEWCVENGIQVTNNSYGSSGDPGTAVKAAFDNATAAGILNVCAAGNDGNPAGRGDNVIYPARYDSCIAVAATDQSDSRARWSSTGPDLDISAPGVSINSTLPGGVYGTKSGTSMACPHVAGTLALDLQYSIFDTADDLGDPGWDPKYGWGLLNAAAAAGVSEPSPDDPPEVYITNPAKDATVFGTIIIEAYASDDNGVNQVEFLVDGVSIGVDTTSPYSVSWDTSTVADGSHTIEAIATDTVAQTASDSISVTVDNEPSVGSLYVDVDTDYDIYTLGEWVYITVTVTDDVGGVEGASVHTEINTASDKTYGADGTTASDGTAMFKFKIKKPDGTGTYTITADASKSGYDPGSGSTTFEVQ